MMNRCAFVAISILWIVFPSGAMGANYFSWDADTTTTSKGLCDSEKPPVFDFSDKVEGTASMKLVLRGSNQTQSPCVTLNNYTLSPAVGWGSGKTLYYRFWMKISPDWDWGTRDPAIKKMKNSRLGSTRYPFTQGGFTGYLAHDRIEISECHQCEGLGGGTKDFALTVGYDFHPETNPSVAIWHEYVQALTLQTGDSATARLELFIDGKSVGTSSQTTMLMDCSVDCGNIINATWGFWPQSFFPQMCAEGVPCPARGGGDAGGTIWLDDLSLDDVWNSTFGSTPPPDPDPDPGPLPDGQAVEAFCPEGSNPDSAVLFCDNFEDSATLSSDYFEYNDDAGQFVPVAGEGVSGGHAMRAQWEAGDSDAGDLKVTFGRNPLGSSIANTQDFREIYWRMYLRTGPGWSGAPYKLSRATALVDGNWSQSFIAHVWTDGADTLAIDPASGVTAAGQLATTAYNDFDNLRWLGVRQGATPVFASSRADQWQCIEAHVKLDRSGASDGEFDLWIDGNLDAQISGLNWLGAYADYGINAVFVENHWNDGAPGSRVRYLDNLVISTSRIGCGGNAGGLPVAPILLP